MNMIQNVWFDDAATSAMGEAFGQACKSLRDFGSAVPAIIADLIITAAKDGDNRTQIITFAFSKGLPMIISSRDFVQAGALLSYGPKLSCV
ncbi:MAG: hypothetical protein WCC77_02320, partial [Pseudolabrys sp.]